MKTERSEKLKQRIFECKRDLDAAAADVENLPGEAGRIAAAGDTKKADQIFVKAETAAMMVRKLTATLAALEEQFEEAVEAERLEVAAARADELEEDILKTSARLSAAMERFKASWNELISIEAETDENSDLSGRRFLPVVFSLFRASQNLTHGHGPEKIENELQDHLGSTMETCKVRAKYIRDGYIKTGDRYIPYEVLNETTIQN